MATSGNNYIHIYFREGGENGEGAIQATPDTTEDKALSSDGSQDNPLTVTINSSNNEAIFRKCGIRTQPGYETSGDTKISFSGGKDLGDGIKTDVCWRICAEDQKANLQSAGIDSSTMKNTDKNTDIPANYKSLTISDKITSDKNTLFWIMILAASDEEPVVDRSVYIVTTATIAATETAGSAG